MKNFLRSVILLWLLIIPALAFGQTATKGIGVIKARTQSGREVELYKSSYALLIGVSQYTAGWPSLESVPAELEKVNAALKSHGFRTTKVIDPDSDQLKDAFEDFIDTYGYDKGNRLLFFFSGHGYSRKGGRKGYLVPVDAPDPRFDEKGFLRKAVAMNNILTWSRNIEAKHAMFLFDSCFSGTVFKTKGLPKIPPHISDVTARPVRQFISAGSAGQEVPANSVFALSFIRALRGEGDLDNDGYVTGTELGMYLHKKVMSYEKGQTPQYGKIKDPELDEGDMVFVLASAGSYSSPVKPVVPGPVVLPQQGGASFDDIIRASETQRQAESKWSTWQNARNAEYAQVQKIDGDAYLKPDQKKQAWERFLSAVSQNNPHSSQDDDMRSRARDRIKYWDGQKTLAMAKIVKKPSTKDSFINSIGMKFVYIKPATFMMGSPSNEPGRDNDEKQHRVTLTKGYYMQTTEVTQGQWKAVMGSNPSKFKGDDNPVEYVSWNDAQEFIRQLNQKEGGSKYRLPTEAEWEYACRAGSDKAFANGGISETGCGHDSNLNAMGWYCGNAGGKTHPVAQKKPNSWGLYDMHGNVYEWCQDWYGSYPSGSVTDPTGPSSGRDRVLRGGSWNNIARNCRSADRLRGSPGIRYIPLGFRLAVGQ